MSHSQDSRRHPFYPGSDRSLTDPQVSRIHPGVAALGARPAPVPSRLLYFTSPPAGASPAATVANFWGTGSQHRSAFAGSPAPFSTSQSGQRNPPYSSSHDPTIAWYENGKPVYNGLPGPPPPVVGAVPRYDLPGGTHPRIPLAYPSHLGPTSVSQAPFQPLGSTPQNLPYPPRSRVNPSVPANGPGSGWTPTVPTAATTRPSARVQPGIGRLRQYSDTCDSCMQNRIQCDGDLSGCGACRSNAHSGPCTYPDLNTFGWNIDKVKAAQAWSSGCKVVNDLILARQGEDVSQTNLQNLSLIVGSQFETRSGNRWPKKQEYNLLKTLQGHLARYKQQFPIPSTLVQDLDASIENLSRVTRLPPAEAENSVFGAQG